MNSQHLHYQIAILSFANWTVAALLTAVIGSYALIFSHLDFGRPSDIWLCLLWGLGVPVLGGQFASITPASLASNLGVNVVKPSS
jgi:hypothetical protein